MDGASVGIRRVAVKIAVAFEEFPAPEGGAEAAGAETGDGSPTEQAEAAIIKTMEIITGIFTLCMV